MFHKFVRLAELDGRKRLHCNECKRATIHTLEAQCRGEWNGVPGGGQEFSTYRCGACDTVCYETASWADEEFDYDDDGDPYVIVRHLQFPPPSSASFTFNTEYTPWDLNELIDEMMFSFAGAKLTLATVGLRMVIEFIVNDKKCRGRSLLKKIDDLHEEGHVDERQRALLHKIRRKGNASAHEASSMDANELIAGMGVVDLLLEKLYNGPGRHHQLVTRAESVFGDEMDNN